MPRVKKLDLGMTALDELFMNDKERAENKLPKIFDIPLSEIDDFPDHPYRVLDDEDMQNLMESIRDRGVITPAMVRKKDDGRYEMISGHRRKHASERLGLETLRCEVVEVSRDEAIIWLNLPWRIPGKQRRKPSKRPMTAASGYTKKYAVHGGKRTP